MNLTQKLPAALGLACLMMISSCSKDEVQTPEPQAEHLNTNSNLKTDAATASMSSTKAVLGIGYLPGGWDRDNVGFSNDEVKYPVGVSSIYNLWGDPSLPYVQNMCLIPWAKNISTYITVTTSGTWDNQRKSAVKTKIRYLIPGKQYALTVYVGSSLPKALPGKTPAKFAKACGLTLKGPTSTQTETVDLTNIKNGWFQKVIKFTATSTEMNFGFSASPDQNGPYAYAHLLVTDDAVKQVN